MPDKQFQKLTPVKPKLLVFVSQKLGCGAKPQNRGLRCKLPHHKNDDVCVGPAEGG